MPAIGRAKLTVDFKVPRSRISDTTAHSIICIVRELAANAARHGAAGAIAKDAPNDELIAAIFTVADGGSAFSEDIARYTEEEPNPPELSQRQSEILHAITRGLTNRDIAVQLGVSADCIKQHLNAIFHKLGAATRSEAVAIALRKQLIKF